MALLAPQFREMFCESSEAQRVPGFPKRGVDLWGRSSYLWAGPVNFWGSRGHLRVTSGVLWKFNSQRSSGEVAGEVRETSWEV